jgi:hypothetical protein
VGTKEKEAGIKEKKERKKNRVGIERSHQRREIASFLPTSEKNIFSFPIRRRRRG